MSSLKVLVVEDDARKRGEVRLAIRASDSSALISEADCVHAAREFLSSNDRYDLLILDIALPKYKGETVELHAGAEFLRELIDYDLYPHPKYVIGITGHEDLSELHDDEFRSRFWRLLSTSAGSAWKDQLSTFIQHLSRYANDLSKSSIVDVCLLSALADPELKAILTLPWGWQEPIRLDESTYYRLGELRLATGRTVTIAAASALRMGPVAAAIFTSKFISALRPRIVGMAGLCAGIRSETQLGDIVAASEVWSWESGKLIGDSGRPFSPEPISVPVPDAVVGALQQLQGDRMWLDSLRASYQGGAPDHALNMHIAPIACGTPVVADSEVVSRIRAVNRKTAGIEMESFGVLMAQRAWQSGHGVGFCIKSVCDFADEHKDDSWRAYAAFTSSKAVERLLFMYGEALLSTSQ